MKIIATADLHGSLPEVPECDLLLVAGDICPHFQCDTMTEEVYRESDWLDRKLRSWLDVVPAEHVVAIAGNHDFVFEKPGLVPQDLRWTYLQDTGTRVGDTFIWGTPWVPNLRDWAFCTSDANLQLRTDMMPYCDILLTHSPPYGYADFTAPRFGSVHAGDKTLNDYIIRNKPRAVVCGHIHEGYGMVIHDALVPVYNVARMDENYRGKRPPLEVRLDVY